MRGGSVWFSSIDIENLDECDGCGAICELETDFTLSYSLLELSFIDFFSS